MKKIIFWILGVIIILGFIVGLIILLNSGVIDINAVTSSIPSPSTPILSGSGGIGG